MANLPNYNAATKLNTSTGYTFNTDPRCISCIHSERNKCSQCEREHLHCNVLNIDVDDDFYCKKYCMTMWTTTNCVTGNEKKPESPYKVIWKYSPEDNIVVSLNLTYDEKD